MTAGTIPPLVLAALALSAQAAPPPADPPTGDVVVTGYPPHCKPLPDDPTDAATARAPTQNWYWLVPRADGGFDFAREVGLRGEAPTPPEVLTAPGHWRRAGNAMPSFNFRQPADGTPLCVGRRPHSPSGLVQLQQLLPASAYLCRFVRLTLFAASRKATGGFWLNSSSGGFVGHDFGGNHGWTPVRIEQGPVEGRTTWVGFGIALSDGDVWLYKPAFDIIPDAELTPRDRRHQAACFQQRDRFQRYYRDHPGVPRKEGNGFIS